MAAVRTFSCPVCGAEVRAGAKACPQCGACEKSGWNEEASASDGLDLPTGYADDDEAREDDRISRRLQARQTLWKWTAIVLLALTLLLVITNLFFR